MPVFITRWLSRGCKISDRLESVVGWYLFSLMIEAHKHTQTLAASISGLHKSQFSRLLVHVELAKESLALLGQAIALQVAESRKILVPGSSWSILLIIDSTLHRRSSRHVQNSQSFNHGKGFVVGHQWTNVVLVMNDRVVPLPPIPFYSKNECRRRGIEFKSEHLHIIEYLKELRLGLWVGIYSAKEVVVLMDSAYADHRILKMIHGRGWHFVTGLAANRNSQTEAMAKADKKWQSIRDLFRVVRKFAPFETIRDHIGKGKRKRKEFRARRLIGYIKKTPFKVALVYSEKIKEKGRIYLACSNTEIETRTIVLAYRKRWVIETFHRTTKHNLGLQDAGVSQFDSQVSHVHWTYCAFLLLYEYEGTSSSGSIEDRQRQLKRWVDGKTYRKIAQLCTRFGDKGAIKNLCQSALGESHAA